MLLVAVIADGKQYPRQLRHECQELQRRVDAWKSATARLREVIDFNCTACEKRLRSEVVGCHRFREEDGTLSVLMGKVARVALDERIRAATGR
jgi:hypothetical protein